MMLGSIMLVSIMLFLNRHAELEALDRAFARRDGALVVVSGRRRVGKTRLLLEWMRRTGGVYFVADETSAALQRRYFAEAISHRLPGFSDVEYRDWRGLFSRLSAEAQRARFRGPVILDELPYLVAASPELPSVLQQWVDHEARTAKLVVALSGSSQRMMQGLTLDAEAPLFGRAHAILNVEPLEPGWLAKAFPRWKAFDQLTAWTAFGGIPRYWELAQEVRGTVEERIVSLVLDPLGPLHLEPERLLLDESSAVELRPVLDAIGNGAHRVSEISGRIGKPSTALSRPLERLQGLGLVKREVPFGVPAKDTKRSLYRLTDPFLNLWFRLVAPNRGPLAVATTAQRAAILEQQLPALIGSAFEELARRAVSSFGDWQPAGRWWQGSNPEWDVVSRSRSADAVLVGESKAWRKPATVTAVQAEAHRLAARPLPAELQARRIERFLFVPALADGVRDFIDGVRVVTLTDMWGVRTRR